MRILHVNGERGFSGGEVQMFHLMEYLRDSGEECLLLGRSGGKAADVARQRGFKTFETAMRSSLDLAAVLRIRRALKKLEPDVIHFHTSRAHVLGVWAAAGLGCRARVVTRRMDYPLRRDPFTRFLYGRGVDKVVAISKAVEKEITRIGIRGEHIALIPSGIDVKRFKPLLARSRAQKDAARAIWDIEPGSFVIGAAASLHPRKGLDVLLNAFALVAGNRVEARLLIAGTGKAESELKRLALDLGLEGKVSFLGPVDPIERVLGALDLFCMPSRKEGLGIAVLEAMACGLPVVASSAGGLKESVLHGETGFLVPPDDPVELAKALESVISDSDRMERMGGSGARRVGERYSAKAMAGGNLSLYRELLGFDRSK